MLVTQKQPVSTWALKTGVFPKRGAQFLELSFTIQLSLLIPALSFLWNVEKEGHRLPLPVKGILLPPFMGVAEKSSLFLAPTSAIKSMGLLPLETCLFLLIVVLSFHKRHATCKTLYCQV